jgi:hypothetical protein
MCWPTFGAAAAAVSAVSAAGGGGGGMRLQWRRQRSRLISQNTPHTLIHNTPFSRIFVRLDFFVNPNSVDRYSHKNKYMNSHHSSQSDTHTRPSHHFAA